MKQKENKKEILVFNVNDRYGVNYQSHSLDQYKMYVELADRVSQRRMLANSLFVTISTALLTAFAWLIKEKIINATVFGIIPFVCSFLLCFIWWRTVNSYRQLNSGKFKIIHLIEKELPIRLFDAEWEILEEGRNRKIYHPVSHIENILPICFSVLFFGLLVYVLSTGTISIKSFFAFK